MALHTIKSSGGDYTSLAAWEAATQGDLTGLGPAIAECYDLDDTTDVAIAGWTTTPTDYIEIRAADSARCNGSTRAQTGNTYRLSGTDAGGQLRIAEEYVRIKGIEVRANNATPAIGFPAGTISAPSDLRVEDCVLISSDVTASSSYVVLATEAGATISFRNCLVVGKRRGIDTRNSDAVTIDHCTFYGLGADLGLVCDSEATVTNTAAFGYTSQCFWTGGAAPTGSNNAGSDTSVSTDYTSSLASLVAANEFTNPSLSDTDMDFSLLSGSNLRDAGTGSFATDIAGASRDVSPDIGAFEFVAGGATYTLTPETGSFTLSGGAVGLQFDRVLTVGTGSMTATGGSINLLYDRAIAPETGSLSLTGGAVGIYLNRVLNPETGSLTLTGSDVVLTYTPGGFTYTLTPETGAMSVTGGAVPVLHNKILAPATGSLTLTGGGSGLFYNRAISLAAGNLAVTGSAVGLYFDRAIGLETGTLTLTGSLITLTYSAAVVPPTPNDRILSLDTYARTLTANTRIKILIADAQDRNL